MRAGYYISAFVCCNELQNILDIKLRHDQTIALWYFDGVNNVKLVRYWELERISGYKQHAKAFYNKEAFYALLEMLLEEEMLSLEDVVEIWGTKELESTTYYRDAFIDTGIAYHSIAHLMSAMYYGNKRPLKTDMLLLSLDAGPDSQFEEDAYDKNFYAGGVIKGGKLYIFPIESPARLWSYSFKKFKLREGTLMALATATDTKIEFDISKFDDVSFFDDSTRIKARKIVDEISEFVFNSPLPSNADKRFSEEEHKISAIMKNIVNISQRIIDRNIECIVRKYGLNTEKTTISIAGGFALNCPTNSYLLQKYKFADYQIPPCTSDTGIAAGVGISAFYVGLQDREINIDFSSAYYGSSVKMDKEVLDKYWAYVNAVDTVDAAVIVEDIIKESVVVWVNGNAEIGPRALGNRSLIGDPRTIKTKELLNSIKKRQWWRPVAPIVLDEKAQNWFEEYIYSPNMLLNLVLRPVQRDKVPAILHFDNTARIQSVSKNSNPELHCLLSEFDKKTGVPMLCNTSLNDAGEPIINNLEQAIEFALHKGLKYIYVEGSYRITLKTDTDLNGKSFCYRDELAFAPAENTDVATVIKEQNPYNLSLKELTYFIDNPNLFAKYDIKKQEDALFIKKATAEYLENNPDALQR